MSHDHGHDHCNHDMKFCGHCDLAFCGKCSREWAGPCTLYHGSSWTWNQQWGISSSATPSPSPIIGTTHYHTPHVEA